MKNRIITLTLLGLFILPQLLNAQSQLAKIITTRDNTIIQCLPLGTLANSTGQIFAGRTNQDPAGPATSSIRRGLVYFDIASANLPANAIIDSVQVSVYFSRASGVGTNVMLHKALHDWTEGTSGFSGGSGAPAVINDVTWLHSSYNTVFWTTPGGDFSPTVSGTTYAGTGIGSGVEGYGVKTFYATSQMKADVLSWISSPATNYGWMIRGDESKPQTAKQFYSRQTGATLNIPPLTSQMPTLYIYYTVPSLALSSTSETLKSVANSTTINVTANTNWTTTSSESWLSVNQSVSSGNGTITLTASENTSTDDRTAEVSVSMTGVPTKKIIVTQAGKPAVSTLVSITTSRDATIVQSADGSTGNSTGLVYVGCVGKPNNIIRRGLFYFNIAGNVPSNAIIDSVKLSLSFYMGYNTTLMMYKTTSNWTEGTSFTTGGLGVAATPSDVTWLHSSFNTTKWTIPGGDYDSQLSATKSITSSTTNILLSTETMKTQVQDWLTNPNTNYGWLLKLDNEALSQAGVMTKIYSKECDGNGTTAVPPSADKIPTLNVYYTIPSLVVSSASTTFQNSTNSSTTIAIKANSSWTASTSTSWLSVSQDVSKGNGNVTITASSINTSSSPRTGTVTVSMTGLAPQTITVTQDGIKTTTITGGDWNTPSNWSNGIPTNSVAVTIDGNISITSATNCASLTVNAGKELSIIAAGSLSVAGNIILHSDATNGTATLLNKGGLTVAGTAIVEQYITSGRYWFLSNPTNGGNATLTGTMYSWNESTQNWVTGSASNGTGYILKPSNSSISKSGNLDTYFEGTINSGQVNYSLSKTGTAKYVGDGNNYNGLNLVGNPYPAYLDFNALYAANSEISNTIYYYNSNGGGSYDTYNSNSGSTGNATEFIPPMQAFWVTAKTNGATLSFTSTQQVSSNTAGGSSVNKLKSEIQSQNKKIRLIVARGQFNDENVIVINPLASDSLDDWDSPKMFANNDSLPQIFTKVENKNLVINGIQSPESIDGITLHFSTKKAGVFTLKASEISGLDNYTIQLKDNVLGTTKSLSQDSIYTFTSDTINTSRFKLLVKADNTATEANTALHNFIKVSKTDEAIVVSIDGKIEKQSTAIIYNTLGEIVTSIIINDNYTVIPVNLPKGLYFVKVTIGNSITTKSIIY